MNFNDDFELLIAAIGGYVFLMSFVHYIEFVA